MNASKRLLRRSRSNRMIAGVAGGLAEYFGVGAFFVRFLLLLAFVPGGVPGLALYMILWLVIPG